MDVSADRMVTLRDTTPVVTLSGVIRCTPLLLSDKILTLFMTPPQVVNDICLSYNNVFHIYCQGHPCPVTFTHLLFSVFGLPLDPLGERWQTQ